MMKTETTEDIKLVYDKLISDFIGELTRVGYINEFAPAEENLKEGFYEVPHAPYSFYLGNAKYDTSWEWLMPVIEKINNLGKEYNFTIHKTYCSCSVEKVGKMYKDFSFAHSEIKQKDKEIEASYKLVGRFLVWYNTINIK